MEGFSNWFHEVLFSEKQDDHLPIFGDIDFQEYQSKRSSPFGKVQTYLINEYLSQPDSCEKVIQISLALICYWYQTFHSNFFFEREQEYWKDMIESLAMMTNKQGEYSLRLFDYHSNWKGQPAF
jgi:hypothetical protein